MQITALKFRIYSIIAIMLFFLICLFGALITNFNSGLRIVIVSLLFSLIYCEISRWIVQNACTSLPGLSNSKKRFFFILQYVIPCVFLIPIIEMQILEIFKIVYFKTRSWNYVFYFGVNFLCLSVMIILYKCFYYIQNWKIAFAESERMMQINLNSQFELLRDQIKPHFLFNSLNTLAYLIHHNQERAEEFVIEMSKVYRYFLNRKQDRLTTLKDEISFLHSYISMLKTRFGDALSIDMKINASVYEYFVPPFVLQLLIENAVKHNLVSKDRPLAITIQSEHIKLSISNPIQLKTTTEPSDKTGLSNIISRYKLLNKENDVNIQSAEGVFKVTIPLIINKE